MALPGSGSLLLSLRVFISITAVLELLIVPRERERERGSSDHHILLRVDAVLIHHVAQVSLTGSQQVVGPGHEPRVLSQTFLLLAGA